MQQIQGEELMVTGKGSDARVLLDITSYNYCRLPNTVIHDDGVGEQRM